MSKVSSGSLTNEPIIQVLSQSSEPLSATQILTRLGLNPGQLTALKRAMRALVRSDRVEKKGRRYGLRAEPSAKVHDVHDQGDLPSAKSVAEWPKGEPYLMPVSKRAGSGFSRFSIGVLRRHADGYGFVEPLSGGRTGLYLPGAEARRALDGDLVKVEVVEGHRGRPAGRFVKLVEQRRMHAIGTYVARQSGAQTAYVIPRDPAVGPAIGVYGTLKAQDGDLVKVRITRPPGPRQEAAGELVEVLGERRDPAHEVMEIAFSQGFADEFPPPVIEELEQIPSQLGEHDRAGRRDLRSLDLITIDGEDARDFDDAVYVERLQKRYRLVVAIADVAHYVKAGRPLDHEALRRATSVYFPGFALPMLPTKLSNDLCSLNPRCDRLCMVADLVFEPDGEGVRCVNVDLYEAVMNSAARCTYNEVAQVLGGQTVASKEFLRPHFQRMDELARLLTATRAERGSIDFDLPEAKVVLDERHYPVRVERRPRNAAHRLIEEFMLAANEAVARYFSARELPTVYRVHGEPDEEKLQMFLALARAHGFALETGQEITGKVLNALLQRMEGSAEQRTLNHLLLRSMMQALYSSKNIGHFGLAAPFYLHFTSPIRRYPDLMVHRLLKEHWARGASALGEREREKLSERLDGISARSSERERAAMTAERDATSYFAALYLKDRVGEEYDGVVAATTSFGFFVEIKDQCVEGLVKAENVGEGSFDEARHCWIFAGGMKIGLGTEVRIRVAKVDVDRRFVDFELLMEREPGFRPGKRHAGPKKKPAFKRKSARRR